MAIIYHIKYNICRNLAFTLKMFYEIVLLKYEGAS